LCSDEGKDVTSQPLHGAGKGRVSDTSLPPILTSSEAAAILRCTPKTVEDRLRAGDLPGEKFGESWILPSVAFMQRVNEIAIEKMLERRALRGELPDLVHVGVRRGRRELPRALVLPSGWPSSAQGDAETEVTQFKRSKR
jgi:hypothetical protein